MTGRASHRQTVSLPLPPPVVSNVEGTWAHDTMSRRIRTEILEGMVLKDNGDNLTATARERVASFVSELGQTSTTELRPVGDEGFDVDAWNEIIGKHRGETWLDAPWVVTEYYFYRRILEAVGYFEGDLGDPFETQKENGLKSCFPALPALGKLLQASLSAYSSEQGSTSDPGLETTEYYFRALLLTSLWGNRMDLSIWPAEATSDEESTERARSAMDEVLKNSSKMLLADHSDKVWAACEAAYPSERMDIVADNAGFELICDLCLADFLVSSGMTKKVVIHLKAYPVFVSDAMEKDALRHIEALGGEDSGVPEEMRAIASRWPALVREGKWELKENPFWVLPLAFWEMPEDLTRHFESSSMVFVKGDANYRRQIGERTWDFATPFETISDYWGAPVCCLRTMKSEVACGISEADQKRAREKDEAWLVSGRYGVVHAKV